MSESEERLYYACMRFCEAFFKVLCEKEQLLNEPYHDKYTRDKILRFNEEYLNARYDRLYDAMEEMENSRMGVVGKRKFKLVLKEIEKGLEE